jgi:hypothetical protein
MLLAPFTEDICLKIVRRKRPLDAWRFFPKR